MNDLNELTVRYAQNNNLLKIPTYSTHSDNFSLAIKFNNLGFSKFNINIYIFFRGGGGGMKKFWNLRGVSIGGGLIEEADYFRRHLFVF